MEHHSSPLHPEGEDLLQAALSNAFTVEDLPRQSVTASEVQPAPPTAEPTPSAPAAEAESAPASDPVVSTEDFEAWRAEYEAQVAAWQKESAKARERAAAERAKWEAIREREKREGKSQSGAVSESWESVSGRDEAEHELGSSLLRAQGKLKSEAPQTGSPSPVDARDLVAGEKSGAHTQEFVEAVLPRPSAEPAHEAADTAHAHDPSHTSSSPHWEDVPSSLTSSFPSMSFPEASRPESPEHHAHAHNHFHRHDEAHHTHGHHLDHPHHHHPEPASPSVTLAIFDPSLSPRTRAWALVSALAINMLLPFVNGVMLGFGEIFAKNVVGWFGFGTRGSGVQTAKSVGLGRRR